MMRHKKRISLSLIVLFAYFCLIPPSCLLAQQELTPIQRGKGKAQLCTRCHGRDGLARAALSQKWDGTVENFISVNLIDFREGRRVHAVMNAIAGPMSDIDIGDVAAWYETISGALLNQDLHKKDN